MRCDCEAVNDRVKMAKATARASSRITRSDWRGARDICARASSGVAPRPPDATLRRSAAQMGRRVRRAACSRAAERLLLPGSWRQHQYAGAIIQHAGTGDVDGEAIAVRAMTAASTSTPRRSHRGRLLERAASCRRQAHPDVLPVDGNEHGKY